MLDVLCFDSMEVFFPIIVQDVMEARNSKDREAYDKALKELPEEYRDSWTYLARDAVQFFLMLANLERGREAIVAITKDHYKPTIFDGKKVFQKVRNIAVKCLSSTTKHCYLKTIFPFS